MTNRPRLYPGHQHEWTDAADLECGEVYYGHMNRGEISGMDWSVPRWCNKPTGHKGDHWWDRDKPEPNPDMVRCTVCTFQAPRNAAGLDGRMAEYATKIVLCTDLRGADDPDTAEHQPQPGQETP